MCDMSEGEFKMYKEGMSDSICSAEHLIVVTICSRWQRGKVL